jgi:hypothetical protein
MYRWRGGGDQVPDCDRRIGGYRTTNTPKKKEGIMKTVSTRPTSGMCPETLSIELIFQIFLNLYLFILQYIRRFSIFQKKKNRLTLLPEFGTIPVSHRKNHTCLPVIGA